MVYKYKIGEEFKKEDYSFKIIRYSEINEFGADFHWSEKNYVVEMYDSNKNKIDDKLLATYNFNYNGKFKYIMTENDFESNNIVKMNILRN